MGIKHATPGEVIKLELTEVELRTTKTTALVKAEHFEVIRLCVHAGQEIGAHKTAGPITVQCLQGEVVFSVGESDLRLVPGDWLFLEGDQVHSVKGVKDSVLVLTIIFVR